MFASTMNTRLNVLVLFVFIGLFKPVKAQFFYFEKPSEVIRVAMKLTDWEHLNENEAIRYFSAKEIEYVNTKKLGLKTSIFGKFNCNSCGHFVELVFEDGIIIEINETFGFYIPSFVDLARSFDPIIFEEIISEAPIHDMAVLDAFSQNYRKRMRVLDDKLALYDSTTYQMAIANYYYLGHKLIKRTGSFKHVDSFFEIILKQQITLTKESYNIDGIDLMEFDFNDIDGMIQLFLKDALYNGVTLKNNIIDVEFSELDAGILGVAQSMNDDNHIKIRIDRENWFEASPAKRWYVLYHELGHDALNLEHGYGGRMMNPISDYGYSWSEFWEDRQKMFFYHISK
jgi:hypothetical protein